MPKVVTTGMLVLYFWAQFFMNIYIGWFIKASVTYRLGHAHLCDRGDEKLENFVCRPSEAVCRPSEASNRVQLFGIPSACIKLDAWQVSRHGH